MPLNIQFLFYFLYSAYNGSKHKADELENSPNSPRSAFKLVF